MIRGTSYHLRAALAAMLFATGLAPVGAVAATRSTKADVTIVTPLSLIKDEDLDFGNIIRGTTAGTVVVPPTGARSVTGGPILAPGTFGPSRFAGYGRNGQTVQISVAANSITLNRAGGGATMTAAPAFREKDR